MDGIKLEIQEGGTHVDSFPGESATIGGSATSCECGDPTAKQLETVAALRRTLPASGRVRRITYLRKSRTIRLSQLFKPGTRA